MGAFSRQYEDAGLIAGQPIPIRPVVPEPGEYPLDALGPRLQAAARAIIDKVQIPAAIAAQSVLASAALGAQSFIDAEMPTGEIIPISLFLITVAASGDRKSSADKLALRAVRKREHEMHKDYEQEQAIYNAESAAFKAARRKAETGRRSPAEIKAAIEACGSEPVAPALPMLISDEGTLQGLQRLFAEAMPSLGLFSDEGGQWLGGFAMSEENRGQTGAALSKLWDGSPIKRVRGGEGVTILRGRRLSLHLMIQHRIARRLFSDKELKDQGLLSRILICQPTTKKGTRLWRNPDDNSNLDLEKYDARMTGLLRSPLPMDPISRELKPRVIPLSADARDLFIGWHDAVEAELRSGGAFEEIAGFAAKLPEHSVRIAAVMAYFENRELTEISGNALAAGIKIAKFHAAEALRLFGVGAADEDTENAAVLIEFIRSKGFPAVGGRYLSRSGPGRSMNGPVLKRAIALLVEMKHLAPIAGGCDMVLDDGEVVSFREGYTVIVDEDDLS